MEGKVFWTGGLRCNDATEATCRVRWQETPRLEEDLRGFYGSQGCASNSLKKQVDGSVTWAGVGGASPFEIRLCLLNTPRRAQLGRCTAGIELTARIAGGQVTVDFCECVVDRHTLTVQTCKLVSFGPCNSTIEEITRRANIEDGLEVRLGRSVDSDASGGSLCTNLLRRRGNTAGNRAAAISPAFDGGARRFHFRFTEIAILEALGA